MTEQALAFLHAGLSFEHRGWRLSSVGGVLYESGSDRGRRQHRLHPVQVQELLGTMLLEQGEALPALEAFLAQGLEDAGQAPMPPGHARERLLEEEPALCARLSLPLQPKHAGEVVAQALSSGLILEHGDRESWSRWSATKSGFLYEAGDHFGPEGDAHEPMVRAALVARWAKRFTLRRGRLEGYAWPDLERCLAHLGQPSVRCWLEQQS